MAEKRCATFCTWIYDFETVCRILLKKKSTDSQLGFLFVDFFSATLSITTLATAKKKLSMGPYGKEPVCQFFRWVLYIPQETSGYLMDMYLIFKLAS